ncbi:MAG: caspase family protein [Longimicrobiales bacterium]
MKTTTPLAALALSFTLVACGGDTARDKDGAMKSADAVMAPASKEGPGTTTKSAQMFTAAHTGDAAAKDIAAIEVGQTRSGALSSSDPRLDDGSHYDLWTLSLGSETDVDIQLTSSDFDTYLMLNAGTPGSIGRQLASDDDGGTGTDSRIAGTLEPGSYVIAVNSYGAGAMGSYELTVGGTPDGAGGTGAAQGRLQAGGTVSGRLTSSAPTLEDGSHYHLWQFDGEAGQQVTITLTSDDFDSYLMLVRGMSVGPDGALAHDDDGAGGLNSRITFTLPETGTYSAVANSYGAGSTGAYEIRFQTVMANWDEEYPGGGDPNGKYAVVVGIDDYPGTRADLRGPVDDAMLVRDALVNRFDFATENIVFLRDGEATRLGIANAILRHLGQAGPDGTAVFFYSGHGTQLDENVGITGRLDPESDNNKDEALAVYDGIILDEEVNFLLQQIEAENTLVLVDACYSGTVNRAADAMAKFIPEDQAAELRKPTSFITADLTTDFGFGSGTEFQDALANPDRHVFMAASSEDELSWAIGSWPDRSGPASLWTYYWAEVVNEVPTSTTFNEIQRMVSERVNSHVQNSQSLDTQTPQLLAPAAKANMSIGAFLGG